MLTESRTEIRLKVVESFIAEGEVVMLNVALADTEIPEDQKLELLARGYVARAEQWDRMEDFNRQYPPSDLRVVSHYELEAIAARSIAANLRGRVEKLSGR